MEKSRDEVLKLLSDIHARECAYHNHKETSAWAATALFAAFVGATFQFRVGQGQGGSSATCWYTAYVLVLAILVTRYVFVQFRLCRWAAAYVAASDFVRMEIVSKQNEFDPTDFAPAPLIGETGSLLNTWVPRRLHTEIARVQQQGQGARNSLEVLAYAFISIITIGALYHAWVA